MAHGIALSRLFSSLDGKAGLSARFEFHKKRNIEVEKFGSRDTWLLALPKEKWRSHYGRRSGLKTIL
jgi:hypothetical protein